MTAVDVEAPAASAQAPAAGRSRWWRHVPGRGVTVVAAATVLGTRLVLGLAVHGPRVFPDETGYLAAGRLFAASGARFDMGSAAFYHPAYSVLLAPGFRFLGTPLGQYRWAMVVNALLGVATFVLLRHLLRRLFPAAGGWATAGALVAATYPPALVTTTLAWAESLLPLAFLALVLAALRLAETPSPGRASAFAASGVACYAVHPRAVVLVPLAAAGLVGCGPRLGRRGLAVALVALVAALVAVVVLDRAVEAALYGAGKGGGDSADPAGLASADRLTDLPRRAVGQLWYQATASLGLAVVGAVALARTIPWRRLATVAERPAAFGAALALASVAATLAISSYVMVGGTRVDYLFYGRYNDALTPLVLGSGVVALGLAPRARALRLLGIAAVTIAALAAVFRLVQPRLGEAPEEANTFFVLGLDHLLRFFDDVPRVGWITAATLAAVAALAAAHRIWPPLVPALAAAVLLGAGLSTWADVVRPDDRRLEPLAAFPREVADVTGGAPVSYDWAHRDIRGAFAYQWWDPDLRYDGFDEGTRPRRPWVVAAGAWAEGVDTGARVAAVDAGFDQALWVLPGPEQERLAAAGRLLPTPFPAPLPVEAARARLELLDAPEPEATSLSVRVTHAGRGSPWPRYDPASRAYTVGRVRVGARVYDGAGDEVAVTVRGDLPRTLLPGDSAVVEVDLPGGDLAPGRYRLVVDVLQESVAWFGDGGSPTLSITLVVPD